MDKRIEGKWIYFDLWIQKSTTQVWRVMSKREILLGFVKWYSAWRTYAFFPEEDTVYEDDCLFEIANFIKRLMDERKLQKL